MLTKAEKTTQYILETVAPVFNKLGYSATSMSHITKATGLTKGAVYGNFQNKEQLALEAFNYNLKRISDEIRSYTSQVKKPIDKLFALTKFYRSYHDYSSNLGGCPFLNIGVDAKNNNPDLHNRVKQAINDFQNNLIFLIEKGVKVGDFKKSIDPKKYACRIFSLMEGSIFMAITMNDRSYLTDMMDFIDNMINTELKN